MPNASLPSRGILRNQLHPAKVLNSEFYLCPPSKSHVPNYLIDSNFFLIQKFQGIRLNKSNNKIVNMADTFSDMAADSPVPVLSGTHSDISSTVKFFLHAVVVFSLILSLTGVEWVHCLFLFPIVLGKM